MQRELEVLSEQYSQKCLENAHLAQALEAERQALRQCQRENQELNAHNQVTIVVPTSQVSHTHAEAEVGNHLLRHSAVETGLTCSHPTVTGQKSSDVSVSLVGHWAKSGVIYSPTAGAKFKIALSQYHTSFTLTLSNYSLKMCLFFGK